MTAVYIDKSRRFQTFEGFGASAAWWAQEAGAFPKAKEIMDLLYSKEKGIGLNIYRYNLGAGSEKDETIIDPGKRAESFINEKGELDFTRDKNARLCLEYAREACGNNMRTVLFSNSAPVTMTLNGKAYSPFSDSDDYVTNLPAEKYEAFVSYVYACTEHFVSLGYNVTAVSPVNEPQWSWRAWKTPSGKIVSKQEGCHFSPKENADLLEAFVHKFKGSDLEKKGVKIEAFESGRVNTREKVYTDYLDEMMARPFLRNYFDKITFHSYWASEEEKKAAFDYTKKNYPFIRLAATEYCQMTDDTESGIYELFNKEKPTNGLSMPYGLNMAGIIVSEMTVMNCTEWSWWLACSFGVYPDGLIYLSRKNPDEITFSKRYYCLGNFSKFISPGAVRIFCESEKEGIKTVAFENPDGSVTAVLVNKTEEALALDIKGAESRNPEMFVTDESRNLEKVTFDSRPVLPPLSVCTLKYNQNF